MRAIYEPKGKAGEYAEYACNLWTGCSHACIYCYSPAVLRMDRHTFNTKPLPRTGALVQLEADCKRQVAMGRREVPVLFCFTCDPYQPGEADLEMMPRVIETMNRHQIPIRILTKSSLVTRDMPQMLPATELGMTLTFSDTEDSRTWEPRASEPGERVEALRIAKERHGLTTWASLEPIIDPSQTLDLINQTHRFVDHYKIGKWNYSLRADGMDWPEIRYRLENRLLELGFTQTQNPPRRIQDAPRTYYLKHSIRSDA